MAVNKEVECLICDDEEFDNLEDARQHALDEHSKDIVEEEWGNYFIEAND